MSRIQIFARAAGVSVLAALVFAMLPVASALADTTIGQTGTPASTTYWFGGDEIVSPGYLVPTGGGTIISLQTQSGDCNTSFGFAQGTYDLQVLRPEGNNQYLVLGDSGNHTDQCDGQLHSYPVNIRVQAGDVLGVYVVTNWEGALSGSSSLQNGFIPEPAVGQVFTADSAFPYFLRADESATLITDSDLTLAQPSDVTVDATSPAGAAVTYPTPAASDEDLATVTVQCAPASGSTFAIGDTTVTCTATDTDGDTNSPVQVTFNVHVKGAADQLSDLYTATRGLGSGTSLVTKVAAVESYLTSGDTTDACGTLRAFINQVQGQSGRSMPASTATTLVSSAQQIEAVIGCG
jgi:HYR domain